MTDALFERRCPPFEFVPSLSSTSGYTLDTPIKTLIIDPSITPDQVHRNLYALVGLVPSDGFHGLAKLHADKYKRFCDYLVKVAHALNPPSSSFTSKIWPASLYNVLSCTPIECLDQEGFDILFGFGYYESLLECLGEMLEHYEGSSLQLDPNFSVENIELKMAACRKAINDGLLNPNNRI